MAAGAVHFCLDQVFNRPLVSRFNRSGFSRKKATDLRHALCLGHRVRNTSGRHCRSGQYWPASQQRLTRVQLPAIQAITLYCWPCAVLTYINAPALKVFFNPINIAGQHDVVRLVGRIAIHAGFFIEGHVMKGYEVINIGLQGIQLPGLE